jgi:uncharacterized protein YggE
MEIASKYLAALGLLAVSPWLIASASQDRVSDNSTMVSITGQGTAQQDTRLAVMQAGVTSFATSAGRSWRQNYEAMAELRSELRRQGIPDKDVRTTSLALSERTKHEDGDDIKGFEVRHNVTVVFRDIDRTGAVLDALVKAGATQIMGPTFSWDANDRAQQIARVAAIRDANQRAQFYARSLGLRIKRVVSIRDGNGYASAQPAAMVRYEGGGTHVSPGEDTVRVAISGEYELVR